MTVYSIIEEPKTSELKNVKKLAPDVSLESCSKNEAKIYSKLPKFPKKKKSNGDYNLFVPNSENLVLFNSRFESGNLK